MADYLTVGAFCLKYLPGTPRKAVSDWLYRHEHRLDGACPIIFGRRTIPVGFAENLVRILKREGVVKEQEVAHA